MSAVKGLELSTVRRMSQVVEEELPPGWVEGLCVLSGPNLASEVVRGMPTPTVIASRNPVAAITVQQIVNSSVFRAYTNDDVVGVELCGALKNIIALGAGMCDGMKLGDNAKSGFMTRGLAEVARLGVAAGANPSHVLGFGGVWATSSPRARAPLAGITTWARDWRRRRDPSRYTARDAERR